MPNILAYLVIFGWPLVVLALFRKLPAPSALVWSILGGYLLLPTGVGIDFPLLPTIDKTLTPSLAAALCCLAALRTIPRKDVLPGRAGLVPQAPGRAGLVPQAPGRAGLVPQAPGRAELVPRVPGRAELVPRVPAMNPVLIGLMALFFLTPVLTVLRNGDPVIAGPTFIAGLRLYDAFSIISGQLVAILPFLLARRFLATPDSHAMLLRALCLAGLGYSLLCLIEVRLSPQLNVWLYGFFPHSFLQHMRAGGFRPIVFLSHGLLVGIFLSMAVLSALALWRHARSSGASGGGASGGGRWLGAAAWLCLTLFLAKTVGAFALTLALAPVLILAGRGLQIRLAAALAVVVLVFPMLRGAGLVPVETIHSMAQSVSEERAGSLKYRLDNEDILLARANERPLAGWGIWGRPRIYDPVTGQDVSVTDGFWVIVIGMSGWFGYLAQFGFLALPPVLLALRQRRLGLCFTTTGLALVVAVNLLDLLPNASMTPLLWLLAGALMGRAEASGMPAATAVEPAGAAPEKPVPARRPRPLTAGQARGEMPFCGPASAVRPGSAPSGPKGSGLTAGGPKPGPRPDIPIRQSRR